MTTSNAHHLEISNCGELSTRLNCGNSSTAGHAMPALFEGVSDAHPLILTARVLRWHLWRIFGQDAAWLSQGATVS